MMYLMKIKMISTTGENTISAITFLYLEEARLKFRLTDCYFEKILLGSSFDTADVDIEL